jgi:hypothetical protein
LVVNPGLPQYAQSTKYKIRDLDLPKSKAELLGSRLQQWNLLKGNVRISVYHKRHEDLVQFFKWKGALLLALILMA